MIKAVIWHSFLKGDKDILKMSSVYPSKLNFI